MGRAEELIKEKIVDRYGSVRRFADAIEVPKTTVYSILDRGIRETNSVDVALKMFNELKLDIDAFAGGMLREKGADPDYVDVPLYGSIAAGTPIEMLPIEDYFPVPKPKAEQYPEGFLLKVKGESMNKKLPNCSYAFVNPTSEATDGKVHAICVNGHEATIKRVRVLNNGFELQPDSDDPTFKPKVYDYGEEGTETITIIGQVVYYVIPFDFEI